MATTPVRIGYIGAGKFSRSRILPALKSIPDVVLQQICNNTSDSTHKVAKEFGFQETANSWLDVATSHEIDALIVGTHANLHSEICLAALEAGKHILTVNAISQTLQEAIEMDKAAKNKPQLVTLVYPGQYYLREDALMRQVLEEGMVGQVIQVIVYWNTPFFGLGSQFEVARRWFGDHKNIHAYRTNFTEHSGGSDHGGSERRMQVNVVIAKAEKDITITYLHNNIDVPTNLARFEIYGTNGMITCYSFGQSKEGFRLGKIANQETIEIPVPAILKEDWNYPEASIPVEKEFINNILGSSIASPIIPRFEDGVKLLEFTEAWRQSLDTGQTQTIP